MKKFMLCITAFLMFNIAQSQEKLTINTQKSSIKWIGEYIFYFGGHDGFINFKEGYFIKTNDVITGGEFIIDMNSITNTDIENKKANKGLVNHLKDPDFFDVNKYPLAKLVITKTEYFEDKTMRIHANLTLKGITKPIKFNATPNYQDKTLKTRFKIDRREWNVSYKSKVKNSAISDAIGFEVSLKL
ncbi:YceI family protein [uncultured Polaribacter sp.]|uniref:YceI family protein n=1 Tax=uncultured Polaribacter sp. TaxID=174711 RepID=UPI002637931B|nr:YceI family protein [uncultured Polaribacter sp.]